MDDKKKQALGALAIGGTALALGAAMGAGGWILAILGMAMAAVFAGNPTFQKFLGGMMGTKTPGAAGAETSQTPDGAEANKNRTAANPDQHQSTPPAGDKGMLDDLKKNFQESPVMTGVEVLSAGGMALGLRKPVFGLAKGVAKLGWEAVKLPFTATAYGAVF